MIFICIGFRIQILACLPNLVFFFFSFGSIGIPLALPQHFRPMRRYFRTSSAVTAPLSLAPLPPSPTAAAASRRLYPTVGACSSAARHLRRSRSLQLGKEEEEMRGEEEAEVPDPAESTAAAAAMAGAVARQRCWGVVGWRRAFRPSGFRVGTTWRTLVGRTMSR